MKFPAGRDFQLWRYSVSHGQLLLRSTKSAEHSTRIDVLFKNVGFVCLKTRFVGLCIEEIERNSIDVPAAASQSSNGQKVFRLSTQSFIGYVAADFLFAIEDEGEYHDASSLMPDETL